MSKKEKYTRQFARTKANKIRRITKELDRNPNNTMAKQTLVNLNKI